MPLEPAKGAKQLAAVRDVLAHRGRLSGETRPRRLVERLVSAMSDELGNHIEALGVLPVHLVDLGPADQHGETRVELLLLEGDVRPRVHVDLLGDGARPGDIVLTQPC